jgi:hypothetical protein
MASKNGFRKFSPEPSLLSKSLLLLILLTDPISAAKSVPVVPNFTQGSLTSRTEQKTKMLETIVSVDYATGWQYTVTGTNVGPSSGSLSPGSIPVTQKVDGVNYTWQGLNLDQKPNWNIVNPGHAFQFTETYSGPGLSQITTVIRETEVESITESTSVFQQ